ncbi:MAG: hypothetical protein M3Y77_07470 [Actinomycetota bacterium]|nr:hypothetical protein [Actinomycetota bacterium]
MNAPARTAVRTLPMGQLHGQDAHTAHPPPRKARPLTDAPVAGEHRYANAGPDCYWELPPLHRPTRS